MSFKNLSILKKLIVGFGAVLFVVAISSALIFKQTWELAETERLNSTSDDAVDFMDQIVADAAEMRAAGYKVVISGNSVDLPAYTAARTEYRKDSAHVKDILMKDAPRFVDAFATTVGTVDAYLDRFLDVQMKLALDPATHQQAVDSVLSSASANAGKAYETDIQTLREQINNWSADFTGQADRSMTFSIWLTALSSAIAILIGAAMAWFIAKSICGPLNAMTDTMRALAGGNTNVEIAAREQTNEIGRIAAALQTFKEAAIEKIRLETDAEANRRSAQTERERTEAIRASGAREQAQVVGRIAGGLNKLAGGDLVERINEPFASDYEGLRGDFNAAVGQLQDTIREVLTSTGTIRSGTGEIASASDDLSRRTEQQAANLEETAAALAEISAAMRRTAEGASHARKVVTLAQSTADESNDVISRTITAMDSIEDASQKISQIIGVIDEIAFQTNLLALNAGVEAARAGDAGRGFAVVASEVRALAQRCAEAAKEVKTLVRSSEEHVQAGVELVGESGKMLTKIVNQVGELRVIVNDIAGSAETQASGLSEVNTAVNQLDQMTQQNAAMAEEATAAAHQLAKEGMDLVRLVGRFNVGMVSAPEPRQIAAPRPTKTAAPRPAVKQVANGGFVAATRSDPDGWQEF